MYATPKDGFKFGAAAPGGGPQNDGMKEDVQAAQSQLKKISNSIAAER